MGSNDNVTPERAISVEFIINGESVPVTADTMRNAIARALDQAGHRLRPVSEWEVRTLAGVLIDPDGSFRPVADQQLILSLCAGFGASPELVTPEQARERLLERAEAEIRLNANGNCADCFGDDAAPLEWRHYPGCYATVNKALDLALARIAELERERDEARAKLPRTDLPRRAYVLTIKVDGHAWDDAMREMEEMFWHVRDHGPECSSVGGGGSAGHVVTVNHDPSITPERHGEWLNEWLDARKDEREKGSE